MNVLKFGGTSVGTPESLKSVKAIVEGRTEPVIVVVSALGGITDKLISTARTAAKGDPSYIESYNEMVERHRNVIDCLVPEEYRDEVNTRVDALLDRRSP